MPNNPDRLLLQSYVDAVRRRWVSAVLTAAAGLAVSIPVALGLPDLYVSSANLIVDQAPDPLGQRDSQMLELNARLQTIRQEALIRQNVVDLAEKLDLYRAEREAGQLDTLVSLMQRDLTVEPTSASRGDGRTTTISFQIRYTGTDPTKVAEVVNRLARFYVDRNDHMLSRQTNRLVDSVRKDLDTARQQLDAQEQKLLRFIKENAATLPSSISSVTAKIAQLRQQLQLNTGQIASLMERREGLENTIATLSTSPSVSSSDPAVRLAQAERELKALQAKYYDNNPEVRNKQREVAGLKEQVAAAESAKSGKGDASVLGTLKGQITGLTDRIETLEQENDSIERDLEKYDALIDQAPLGNAEFERLNREATMARQAYDSASLRFQSALAGGRAQQGSGGPEFQVLDAAIPPDSPSAPNRPFLMMVAAMAALGLGFGVALLRDRMDGSFRSVDELRAFTHVPVLATIPRIVLRRAAAKRVAAMTLAGVAVSAGLWVVSVGVFRVAQQAEPLTRFLLR